MKRGSHLKNGWFLIVFFPLISIAQPIVIPGFDLFKQYRITSEELHEQNVELPLEQNASSMIEEILNPQNLDDFHGYLSNKILIFSSNLDHKLSGTESNESNITHPDSTKTLSPTAQAPITSLAYGKNTKIKNKQEEETYLTSVWLGEFFKDETYLDRTNRSYLKVRGGYEYDRRGDSGLFYNLTARIKLPKTQGKLQLYIGEDTQDNINLSTIQYNTNNEGIGVKYFITSFLDKLHTSASIGISSIDNPYAKARIEYPYFFEHWMFNASQNFKLSVKNEFEEWTNFFFDRKLSDQDMLRFLLQRSTVSTVKGMNYLAQVSYMNSWKDGLGLNNYIAINGRTRDLADPLYANGTTPQEGVYEYSIGSIWRQKLYKDYLFYQLQPIISYHEQYDYKVNYIFRISLDLYFGNNL